MTNRLLICVLAVGVLAACSRERPLDKELKIVDVHTGWYDAGIVADQNKLVPSISLKIQDVSREPIAGVQLNAIFRKANEPEVWGEHFVRAIDRDGLAAGATTESIVLRSGAGVTGTEPRLKMLENSQFVDARVVIFGKYGSQNWVKLGEYPIERKLLTE